MTSIFDLAIFLGGDGVSFHSLIMQINAKQNSFKFEFEYKKISRVPIRMSRLFEE